MINRILLITALCLVTGGLDISHTQAQTTTLDSDVKMLSSQKFSIPPETIAAGVRGTVKLIFTVSKTGEVDNVDIYAGPSWPCGSTPAKEIEEVRDAIKQSVRSSQFSPRIKDGKPVGSDAMLSFDIDLAIRGEKPPTGKTISGGVLNGKALTLPKPSYPAEARSRRVSGSASIQVLIDERGKVISAGAISGHPLLQLASREAACDSKFAPTLLAGQPVKVSGIITYNFIP